MRHNSRSAALSGGMRMLEGTNLSPVFFEDGGNGDVAPARTVPEVIVTLLRRRIPSPAGSQTHRQQAALRRATKSATRSATRSVATRPHHVAVGAIFAIGAVLAGMLLPASAASADATLHAGSTTPSITGATAPVVTATSVIANAAIASRTTMSALATTAVLSVFVAPAPTISGTHAVGQTLAANVAWVPVPDTFTFRWKRAGVPIYRAIHQTYRLTKSDAGKTITVTVKGVKAGYTSVTKTSAAVRIQKVLTATPIPKISGTVAVGKKLTAVTGTWGPSTVTLHYAWIIDGFIVGTRPTFVIPASLTGLGDLAGKYIAVYVTGLKTGYTSVTRMSLSKLIK